jgi:hypothetical protein
MERASGKYIIASDDNQEKLEGRKKTYRLGLEEELGCRPCNVKGCPVVKDNLNVRSARPNENISGNFVLEEDRERIIRGCARHWKKLFEALIETGS